YIMINTSFRRLGTKHCTQPSFSLILFDWLNGGQNFIVCFDVLLQQSVGRIGVIGKINTKNNAVAVPEFIAYIVNQNSLLPLGVTFCDCGTSSEFNFVSVNFKRFHFI